MAITYDIKVNELDKTGNYSVTAIVTDDTWRVDITGF